jgi:hypothetical protein
MPQRPALIADNVRRGLIADSIRRENARPANGYVSFNGDDLSPEYSA